MSALYDPRVLQRKAPVKCQARTLQGKRLQRPRCHQDATHTGIHGHALCWTHYHAERNPNRALALVYSGEPLRPPGSKSGEESD